MITLQQFINKYEGKAVGVPWGYVGECVSLVQRYLNECYGLPMHARGNGKDWQNTILKEKIGVTTNHPVRGDIVVWGANAGGGYGHVTIYLDDKLDFDQNQGGDRFSRVRKRHPLKPIAYMHLTGKRPMEPVVKPSNEIAQNGFFKATYDNMIIRETPNGKDTGKRVIKNTEVPYTHYVDNGDIRWVKINGGYVARRKLDNSIIYGDARFGNEAPKPKVIELGSKVTFNSPLNTQSNGNGKFGSMKSGSGVIGKIVVGAKLPYHIQGKGWGNASNIKLS